MAKENILFLVIILSLFILPGNGVAAKAIQTSQRIIVIDPGHGGPQKGIDSSSGIQEKAITLKLAKKAAQILEARYNVILTRSKDVDIPVRERIFTANKVRADLFISIHLNHSAQLSGFFYYFDLNEIHHHPPSVGNSTWKSQALLHQTKSKQAVKSFFTVFSINKKAFRFFQKSAPILLLEGATMPAVLIEPLSISTLHQPLKKIESILEETALIIAKSIDLYFKNN